MGVFELTVAEKATGVPTVAVIGVTELMMGFANATLGIKMADIAAREIKVRFIWKAVYNGNPCQSKKNKV